MGRMYSSEEAKKLRGKLVICDERGCDGKGCHGSQNIPHPYDDHECYHSCEWPGHEGLCVPVDNPTT